MLPDFQSLSTEKPLVAIEQERHHEIPLRGGSFKFSVVDGKKKGMVELKSAVFVGKKRSRDLFDFFQGYIPVESASFFTGKYLHDDPESSQIESIQVSELKTEKELRILLHEGGHFKQSHEPMTERVAALRKEFFDAHRAYQPLENLFAIADQFVVSVPSLRGEFEMIKARYEQTDKKTLEPPVIDPEVIRQRAELKDGEQQLEIMRVKTELAYQQMAKLCMATLSRTLSRETLPVAKRILPLLEKVAAGTLKAFMDPESMCGAEFDLNPVRMVFSFLDDKKDIVVFSLSLDAEDSVDFQGYAELCSEQEEQIETLSRHLSDVRFFLSTNDKTASSFMQTHRYFDIAGSGAQNQKTDRDVSLKTLTYFMDHATLLLERDATERAIAWMEELRTELGIDLLSHEEEDWYLTLDCLGTYGANSSQLEEKLGVIPRIEGVAHLN